MTRDAVRILLNPNAGSATELARYRAAVRASDGHVLVECDGPESLADAVGEAVGAGARAVVAAGGDGTLNDVLNALGADGDGPALGVLPFGTGNDFARALGLPLEPERALAALLDGALRPEPVDLMRVSANGDERLAINAVNGGFGARVGDQVDPDLKRLFGRLAYLLSGGRALAELTDHRLEVRVGGEKLEIDAWNFFVMNGTSVGGGILVAPDADPGDGRLEIAIVPALKAADLLERVPVLLDPDRDEGLVIRRRSTSVRIDAEPPMTANRDGESCGGTPVEVELLPGAIRFLRPRVRD